MEKVKAVLDKILEVMCVVLFIAMVLLTTYQVAVRYIFKSPSATSETLTRYMFVWLILLSATYIFGRRDHICISFIRDKFTGSTRRAIDIIIEVVIIFFSASILVYGGAIITQMNMLQYDSILKIPTGTIYSVIPVCGVLIIFYSIINIGYYLKKDYNLKEEGGS